MCVSSEHPLALSFNISQKIRQHSVLTQALDKTHFQLANAIQLVLGKSESRAHRL